jgi:SAM-dependent methyltransferase
MTPEELHNIFRTEQQFWWYEGMREITHALLEPVIPRKVLTGLDAGCGTGFNAQTMEKRYGIKMFGFDLAPLGIQYARKRGLLRSLAASTLSLPFADSSFDFVSSIDVLPVLPEGGDRQAISELARVLRPGGLLYLRSAAFNILRSRHSQFVAERKRYRGPEIVRLVEDAGLRMVRESYANFFLSPIAFLKFRVWEPLANAPPRSGVSELPSDWLNRALAAMLRSEAKLLRLGVRFPFGQSWLMIAQKPLTSGESTYCSAIRS